MTVPFAHLGPSILGTFGSLAAIQVERRAAGSDNQTTGNWDQGALSTLTLTAAVMPATPREMQALPEGARSDDVLSIFTLEPLRLADTAAATAADVVIYDGRRYQVILVEDWSKQAEFAHAFASRLT